jgi:uncharacterized repeat protein (TIGR01451 family)
MNPFTTFLTYLLIAQSFKGRSRRTVRQLAGLFIAGLTWGIATAPSWGQTAVFQFRVESTGTAPFDNNDLAGNDSSKSNAIVRTQDVISYEWQYAVNGGNAQNVILKATIPAKLEVTNLPPACIASGSSLLINTVTKEQNIICSLGTINSGSSGSLSFPARVLGKDRLNNYVANGQTVVASGSWQADGIAPILGTAPITTISAAPKVDLRKDAAYVEGVVKGSDGVTDGFLIRYPITAAIAGGSGKGSEALIGDLNFTDTLLNTDTNSAVSTAKLYTWGGRDACGWMGQDGYSYYGGYPFGKRGLWVADDRSVNDSGTWNCSQSAAGAPININISGADVSGNTFASKTYDGGALPANVNYMVSGTIHIWVPLTSVTTTSTGQLNVRNDLSLLTTPGASGQPNTEPDASNNGYSHTLVGVGGSLTSRYHNSANDPSGYTVLPGMSSIYGGDGVVVPGQNFSSLFYMVNNGGLPWQDFNFCGTIDNRTQQVTPLSNDPTKGVVDFSTSYISTNYVIEYGTGNYNTYDDQKKATCRDGTVDSPTGWQSNLQDVPGGAAAVSRIRVRSTGLLPPGFVAYFNANLTARSTDYITGAPIPVGTKLTETVSFYIKDYNFFQGTTGMAPQWTGGYYDPTNHWYVGWGDRLALTKAIVRIDKQNVPNQPTVTGRTGDTLNFVLNPTLTLPITPPPSFTPSVVVKDVLPKGLTYIAGSASIVPTQITPNLDGTTTLEWNLGPRTPNQVIPPITLSAKANFDVPNNSTLVNSGVIESPDDASLASARTDTASVLIGNTSAFGIYKEVQKQLIDRNENIVFNLFYANTGASDVSSSQFIDILPYQNNNLLPNTNYQGNVAFSNVVGNNGETFEYTKNSPTSIVGDPNDPSNQPGGSTIWCSSYSGGNCPSSAAQVTAIRVNAPLFSQATPTRKITITMATNSNQPRDIYSNRFYGRGVGLLGLLTSNDVFSKVKVPANLVLVKRVTAINSQTFTQVLDDPNVNDNDPSWPSGFLQGRFNNTPVNPGDDVEYTIYFLSSGDVNIKDVNICDLVPPNTNFITTAFNGGSTTSDRGLNFLLGNTQQSLTNAADGDQGSYLVNGTPITDNCGAIGSNTNGAVVVKVGNLSHSGPGGTKPLSYGWVKFRTQVKN